MYIVYMRAVTIDIMDVYSLMAVYIYSKLCESVTINNS